MSSIDKNFMTEIKKAIADCPTGKLVSQRLDQIDKFMDKNGVQHGLFFSKFEELKDEVLMTAPKISKELSIIFKERDAMNEKKFADKRSEVVVYGMVAIILVSFLSAIVYAIGWNH